MSVIKAWESLGKLSLGTFVRIRNLWKFKQMPQKVIYVVSRNIVHVLCLARGDLTSLCC